MATTYEGLGKPKIVFVDGSSHLLPEPIGSEREGLRAYDFEMFSRDQYWSESGQENTIGKKFIFVANLKWITLVKNSQRKLWRAQKETGFTFILNEDEPNIKYKCKVTNLRYRFFKGIPNHRAAYSVELSLRGTQLLDSPGYGTPDLGGTGYGTNYGGDVGNQSP